MLNLMLRVEGAEERLVLGGISRSPRPAPGSTLSARCEGRRESVGADSICPGGDDGGDGGSDAGDAKLARDAEALRAADV